MTEKDLDSPAETTRVYSKRWLVLFIFSYVSFLNAFNWIEYNIIQDVTGTFYNASLPDDETSRNNSITWFSMVYMLCYIFFVLPSMFLLDRYGLKISVILGALCTTVGSVIKCLAVRPDLFPVAMLGQTVCGLGQAFILSVPARLSALWFGPTQIALATSIGVFGNQLGLAAGFLIPPNLVKMGTIDSIETSLYYLLITMAILCFIGLLLSIIYIQDEPDLPPSLSQLEVRKSNPSVSAEQSNLKLYKTSLCSLFKNFNFLLILVSYGINVGAFYAISTLLNQTISGYYKNENSKIGLFGLILVLTGLVGSIVAGIILDKSKKFKAVTFVFYIGSFLSMALFTATLEININVIFVTSGLLGFFMTGYLPVGFELATEVTYPEPESTSCGLLNSAAQVFGILFTIIQEILNMNYGPLYGNIFICVALLLGTILTGLVKSDLRRQKCNNVHNSPAGSVNKTFVDECDQAPIAIAYKPSPNTATI